MLSDDGSLTIKTTFRMMAELKNVFVGIQIL